MRQSIFLLFFLQLFISCGTKQLSVGKNPTFESDVITLTDDGKTSSDTMMWSKDTNGMVVSRNISDSSAQSTIGGKYPSEYTTEEIDTNKDYPNEVKFICIIQKKPGKSLFTLVYANPLTGFPASVVMRNIPGPENGVGLYKLVIAENPLYSRMTSKDSLLSQMNEDFPGCAFVEKKNGNNPCMVDSTEVSVTKVDGNNIEGSFRIWVSAPGKSKEVTGKISWHSSKVEIFPMSGK